MLEDRLDALFKDSNEYTLLDKMKGSSLEGIKYKPLFDYFIHMKSGEKDRGAFRVVW